MRINGRIFKFIEKERLLHVLFQNQVYKLKFTNNDIKKYSRYFSPHTIVDVEADELYTVTKVYEIHHSDGYNFYNNERIKAQLRQFIFKDCNKLFIDLELMMHPFKSEKKFVQEIIQIGYYLEDSKGNLIKKNSYYIKPKITKTITDRTIKFLNITQEQVDNGNTFEYFHKELESIMVEYEPKIYIWGINDYLSIEKSLKMHKLSEIVTREDYTNLMSIYKVINDLKDDMGLYNCYKLYTGIEEVQNHDALEDARITREIFHLFREELLQIEEKINYEKNKIKNGH